MKAYRLSLLLASAHLLAGVLPAADVAFYGILKSQQFMQTNGAAPAPLANDGFAFNAFVFATTNHVVTNATVKPPNSTSFRTLLPEPGDLVLRFGESFGTQAALDGVYPNGGLFSSYSMTLYAVNDGTKVAALSFTIFGIPIGNPPTPQFTEFAAAQSIDHSADFTLRWSLSGGNALDLVELLVLDQGSNTVFTSPSPFTAGALSGASTSISIPAYTLPPGTNLTAHLSIARLGLPNTNSYPGAIGIAALLRDTQFPMSTRPAPVPPHLEVVSSNGAPFRLRFSGETNRNYHIQATPDFLAWQDLFVTNSATGIETYTDGQSSGLNRRFYRVQVGP